MAQNYDISKEEDRYKYSIIFDCIRKFIEEPESVPNPRKEAIRILTKNAETEKERNSLKKQVAHTFDYVFSRYLRIEIDDSKINADLKEDQKGIYTKENIKRFIALKGKSEKVNTGLKKFLKTVYGVELNTFYSTNQLRMSLWDDISNSIKDDPELNIINYFGRTIHDFFKYIKPDRELEKALSKRKENYGIFRPGIGSFQHGGNIWINHEEHVAFSASRISMTFNSLLGHNTSLPLFVPAILPDVPEETNLSINQLKEYYKSFWSWRKIFDKQENQVYTILVSAGTIPKSEDESGSISFWNYYGLEKDKDFKGNPTAEYFGKLFEGERLLGGMYKNRPKRDVENYTLCDLYWRYLGLTEIYCSDINNRHKVENKGLGVILLGDKEYKLPSIALAISRKEGFVTKCYMLDSHLSLLDMELKKLKSVKDEIEKWNRKYVNTENIIP